jgi:hypothetical protein
MVKMLSPLARVAALGNNCVSSVGGCSSSTRALSDVRRSPSWRALRRAERWSGGVGSGSPVRGKSADTWSSSSVSTRKLGRTGVISKKPAARCHERAKLLMLFTPPASPIAPICCEMEDLRFVSLGLYSCSTTRCSVASTHLRLRNSPGTLDHVPEAAVLSPLGLLSSRSHCTRLPLEPTEPRWTPSYVSHVDGCFPLISMVEVLMHRHAHRQETGRVKGRDKDKLCGVVT